MNLKTKKQIRCNKGITMIALVITIIVLLILVGITVATLNGDNGIVKKATDAQIMTALSNANEMVELYKIMHGRKMNTEELKEDGILKEVMDESTGRRLGIIQDFDKIKLQEKLGKGYEKIKVDEAGNIKSAGELYNVFVIDFEDDTLYYIKNDQVWSIGGTNNLKEAAEKIKFITEWTITSDNEEIQLPLDSNYKVMVEWGDGKETLVESTNPDSTKHTYEKAGIYNIKIRANIEGGKCQIFRFGYVGYSSNSKGKITKIVQWGEIDVETINFLNCTNLKGEIPSPTDKSFRKVNNFDSLFSGCKNIQGRIPKDLFKNASRADNFYYAFAYCENLEGEIPSELFKDVKKNISSISGLFSNCKNLTGTIPKDLFKGKEIASLDGIFQNCSKITGIGEGLFDDVGEHVKNLSETFQGTAIKQIPKDLFKNNINVISFKQVFNNCMELEEIPDGLFSTNVNATNFNNAFYNCKKLKGKIRKNIFPKETVDKQIKFSCTFMFCTSIEGIEEDAFDNYPNITNFDRAFGQCHSLTGRVPELWKRNNVEIHYACFRTFSTITNYNDIPEDWK